MDDESICESSTNSSIGMNKLDLMLKLDLMKKTVDGC
jgi:hypothetical protein